MFRIFQVFFTSILVLATLHNKIPSLYIVHAIRDAPVPAPPNFGNATSVFPPSIVFSYSIHIPISQSPYLFPSPPPSASSGLQNSNSDWAQTDGRTRFPTFQKKKKIENVSLLPPPPSIGRRKTYHGLPQKSRQTFSRLFPSLPFRAKKRRSVRRRSVRGGEGYPPTHFRLSLSLALFFSPGKRK